MKKFTKIILIIAGVFAAVGIGLSACGAIMGASMADVGFFKELGGQFGRIMSQVFTEEHNDGEEAVFDIHNTPDRIEIDLNYEELILENGDEFSVKVSSNKNDIQVRENGNNLEIKSTKKLKGSRKVYLYYPDSASLKELDIEMGAGSVAFNKDITVDKLSIDVGAGDFSNSGSITAGETELKAGTGNLQAHNLSTRVIEGECGIGNMELELTGKESDYNFSLECGVGDIEIGQNSFSGLGKDKKINNPGAGHTMNLECGIGNIIVSFNEKNHRIK
ncbi:MAG: DUF2807 domain-containing protein [Clostridia bacterium]|nr:DUF2807 domain-containing protein [Clostridia bacterium]MDY5554713.1 DUF2807 domain-containing protein [Blautia sp.]